MNWNSWQDFLAMGGYAVYVWGSYGVTAVALAIEWVLVLKRGAASEPSFPQPHSLDQGAVLHEA